MNISQENDNISFGSSAQLYFLMGFFYLIGLMLYTWRIPERFKPGYFDIWVN